MGGHGCGCGCVGSGLEDDVDNVVIVIFVIAVEAVGPRGAPVRAWG